MSQNPTEALRAAMALIETVRRLWELSSSTRVDEAIRKEWQTATNALSGEFDAASILIVPLLPAAHRLSENTIELGDMSATNAFCLTFELGFHFEHWVKGVQDWAVWNGVQIAEPVSLAKDRFPPMPKPVEWNRLLSRLDLETTKLMEEADGEQKAEPADGTGVHSTGFRSMRWGGVPYSFTANQAAVMKVLYEHSAAGTPDVGDETLLSAVDPEAPPARLNVLFRDHRAWGTMIVTGGTRGTHRLAELAEKNP